MLKTLRQRPIYVLCFLFIVFVPQVLSLAEQFRLGFRPFVQDPVRVPLSWDMFSNRVDRCIVSWTSPLHLGDANISSLRDVELPLEWDIVLDTVEQYEELAKGLCPYSNSHPTSALLHCFSAEGLETQNEYLCY